MLLSSRASAAVATATARSFLQLTKNRNLHHVRLLSSFMNSGPSASAMMNRSHISSGTFSAATAAAAAITVISPRRMFSSKSDKPDSSTISSEKGAKQAEVVKFDEDEHDDYHYQEPRTAGEWVAMYSRAFMTIAFVVAAGTLASVTFYELFPGRMSPNSLVDESLERIRNSDEVVRMIGSPMTGYGRETTNRGRSHVYDSHTYTAITATSTAATSAAAGAEDIGDGSKRLRVRFNVKGPRGKLIAWAEVSNRCAADELVYLVLQSATTGQVLTLVDNRDRIAAEAEAMKDPSGNLINKFFGVRKE